jgi:hypothetical protein
MFLCIVNTREYGRNASEVAEPSAEYTSALLDILVCCLFVLAMLSTAEVIRSMMASPAQRERLIARRFDPEIMPPAIQTLTFRYDAVRTADQDLSYEDLLALSEAVGRVRLGLTDEQISVLPTYTFRPRTSDTFVEGDGVPETVTAIDIICAICREELKNGDELLVLPCLCQFHKECITRWLSSKASCPLCRSVFA